MDCEQCGAEMGLMGVLGYVLHFYCRACGWFGSRRASHAECDAIEEHY